MSIIHVKDKEAYFLVFQGIGISLIVEDGKLELAEKSKDKSTAESDINLFLSSLRTFIKDRRNDIKKTAAIRPLLELMKEGRGIVIGGGDLPPNLISDMNKSDASCRNGITEAENLIIDITDLMLKYNIKIVPDKSEDDASEKDDMLEIAARMKSLLNNLRNGDNS